MQPLYVWTKNYQKHTGACQYYRIKVPIKQLEELGFCLCYEADGTRIREEIQAMLRADICHFYSLGGEGTLHDINSLKAIQPAETEDGQKRYPPIAIYDVDDNTDFVHPMNSTFPNVGVRSYPNFELLIPGNILEWVPDDEDIDIHTNEPRRQILCEDGVTKSSFDGTILNIERNLHEMKIRHEIIRACHGATVSSPSLASYFKEVIGQKNVHIYYNTLVPEDYEFYPVQRENDNIRILWQGSPSHYIDWYPLREALREVDRKYPNVTWVLWGQWFDWVHSTIPDAKIEYHKWDYYQVYKLKRGLLNIDINLCPLANNAFNRCKSAIKWYEGSIWPQPEATLAANVEPYFEIKDGKTGLLYNNPKEFAEKLGILIENVELRKTLGEKAKKWVLKNRTPEVTIPPLYEFLKETRDAQIRALDPRIIVAAR